jgi:hypothetical protein
MLARRTNIRSLSEIEAERRAERQPEGNWRDGIIPECGTEPRYVSSEKLAERDLKIRALRLSGHSLQEIMISLDLSYGRVIASIARQKLGNVGGAAKRGRFVVKTRLPPPTAQRRMSVLEQAEA